MTHILQSWSSLKNRIYYYFFNKSSSAFVSDSLSWITVSLALIPEAIAFAFVAGVSPLLSLQTAIIMGIVAALLTGRPGIISSSTAAIAVVVAPLVASHGLEYLFAAVVMMGAIQLIIGLLKLGKYTSIIPHPVILWFLNGLAILIFIAQLDQFKIREFVMIDGVETMTKAWLSMPDLFIMIWFVLVTMAIIYYFPRLTKKIPSSLVAIGSITAIGSLLAYFDIYHLITVQDFAGEAIQWSLPLFHIPNVPWNRETLQIIFPYAFIGALVWLTEATLTLRVLDDMTNTKWFMNKEYLAQAWWNLVNGIFGGMGGDAMIWQSIINIKSWWRARWSWVVAAVWLFCFLMFAAPLVNAIPLAGLVWLMFIVVISTFERETLKYYGKIPRNDMIVILAVSVITIFFDLATAVIIWVVLSTIMFAREKGKTLTARKFTNRNGQKVYKINGLLFFGSTLNFKNLFDLEKDPKEVIIDLKYAIVKDQSWLEALCFMAKKYADFGKHITVTRAWSDCKLLIDRAQDVNPIPLDIVYDPTNDAIVE